MNDRLQGRCIGLVGGLGVGATIFYYQELVKAHAALGYTPNLIIVHADVSRVFSMPPRGRFFRWPSIWLAW